jgi:hypothetical protein
MQIEGMGDHLDLTGEFARQTRLDGFMDILASLSEQGLVQFIDHEKGFNLQLTRRGAEVLTVRRRRGSIDTYVMNQISLHNGLLLSTDKPA